MTTLKEGTRLQGRSGKSYTVLNLAGEGGQARVYQGQAMDGTLVALKVLRDDSMPVWAFEKRTRWLIGQELHDLSPCLCTPFDELIFLDRSLGHVSPWAPGVLMETWLQNTAANVLVNLHVAKGLCLQQMILGDQVCIGHGDFQPRNVIVDAVDPGIPIFLFDFDNFFRSAADLPPGNAWGAPNHRAPELVRALKDGEPTHPTEASERFALAVVLHRILYRRSPFQMDESSGGSSEGEDFLAGRWLGAPERFGPKETEKFGGYPVGWQGITNPAIESLFRRGLSSEPSTRPAAREWVRVLSEAMEHVLACPTCGEQTIATSAKVSCWSCGRCYPVPALRCSDGRHIILSDARMNLGRERLRAGKYVSNCHVVVERRGAESYLTSLGRNGTYVFADTGWQRVPDRAGASPLLLREGMRLRMADVECTVIVAA
jgi:serine/threonine protein kinase